MKYVLLITQGSWLANGDPAERDSSMEKVVGWWGKQFASGIMGGGARP